jgi:hypothetical protein
VHGLSNLTPLEEQGGGEGAQLDGTGYGYGGKYKKPIHSNTNNLALTLAEQSYMIGTHGEEGGTKEMPGA